MENNTKIVKIPNGFEKGFQLVQSENLTTYLRTFLDARIAKIISNPELALDEVSTINEILFEIQPENYSEDAIRNFIVIARVALSRFEDEVRAATESTDIVAIKKAVGLSSFIGYLYYYHFVEISLLKTWIVDVLVGKRNKFIKLNLMGIVKDILKKVLWNENEADLFAVYKAFLEENLYDRAEEKLIIAAMGKLNDKKSEITKEVESKIYSMIFTPVTELANDFIDKIIESPMTIPFYVKCYDILFRRTKNFQSDFHRAIEERLENIKSSSEKFINILWIESFKAELCVSDIWMSGRFIQMLAERILFVEREQTIIFVIILHKLSTRIKSEDPLAFNKCLEYLKQIIGIFPTSDDFWEPKIDQIEEDLKFKLHRKQLENYEFSIDDFSLERAKFIFKKAFEEHDYISITLCRMENTLGLRLLKIHLSYLFKFKFMTENLEFDLNDEDNPKNAKTSALVRLVARFYECEIVNWTTIMDITSHLRQTKNIPVQAIFCIAVGAKTKHEPDPMFASTKNYIDQICEACEEQDDRKMNNGSISSKMLFKKFLSRLGKDECTINNFDFKQLEERFLDDYSILLIIHPTTDLKVAELTPKICKKIEQVQPKFKKSLQTVLENYYEATLEKCGEGLFIQSFESKAKFIGNLTREKFLDADLMRKYTEKSREILEAQPCAGIWEAFLKVFTIVAQISIWSNTNENLNEFLICMDYIYDFFETSTEPILKKSIEKILNDFDQQLDPAVSAAKANPSFKRIVHRILTRTEPITKNWMKIHVTMRVKNFDECAKYFVINAISCSKTQDFVFFLYFLKGGFCGGTEELKNIFDQESKILILKINDFVLTLFKEQHTQRRGYDENDKKTKATMAFAISMFLHKLMSVEQFKECLDILCDGIGGGLNKINAACLHEFIFNAREELKHKVEPFYDHLIVELHTAIENRQESKIVEVPDTILTAQDIKSAKKLSSHAQMIADSVLKVNDSSPMIYARYLDYCQKLLTLRLEFKTEMRKKIKEISAFYVYAPFVKNLKWPEITKFGFFVACLYENHFIEFQLVEEFFDILSRRIFNNYEINKVHFTKFAKFYLEISKRYPRIIREENVKTLDVLQCFMNLVDSEYKKVVTELLEVFDKSLMFKKSSERIFPSFKYFMHCILSGSDDYKYFVGVDNSEESAKFFFDNAILYPYSRLEVLVKITKKLKFKDEKDKITGIAHFIPEIQKLSKISFAEEFAMKKVKKANRPIGVTKLIAELFINDLYPTSEFNFCAEKIAGIVMEKPTMCNIMSFHNLVNSVGVKINQHPKIVEIKRAKEFVEGRILSSHLEFFDEIIDKIDCEKIVEPGTIAEGIELKSKPFHDFLIRLTSQPTFVDKFNYKTLNEKFLIDYSKVIIKVFSTFACQSLKDYETLKSMTQVCIKIQAIHPKFKKAFEDVLNAEFNQCPQRVVENDLKKNKMYGLGRITGRLFNDAFFDQKLVLKIINELKISIICCTAIFAEIHPKLEEEDIESYLKLIDFICDAKMKGFSEMESGDATVAEISINILLKNFHERLSDTKTIREYKDFVTPSFQYAICRILAKKPQVNYLSDANPMESAKFFYVVASRFAGSSTLLAEFLVNFQKMKKNVEIISEVLRLTISGMEEIFLERKYDEDSDKATNLTAFAGELFMKKFIKLDDFVRCLEVMLDATGFQPNHTTSICIQYTCLTIKGKLEAEVDRKFWHRIMSVIEAFGGFDEKIFEILEIPENQLEFSEIKSKKVEIAAKMIFESVLKIKNITEANYKNYLKFCNHIQKYKFTFVDSIKKQSKEKSVMLIVAPIMENFNWKAIENFGNFLAHLEKDFRVIGKKLSFIKPFLKTIEERFEDEKNVENWIKLLSTFYEISKNHAEIFLIQNVWFVDFIFKCELKNIKEFEEAYKKIIKLYNETLNGEYHIENDLLLQLSPSFKSLLKSLVLMNKFNEEVLVDNVQNHARFYLQSASMPDFTENCVFLKQMIVWKKMKPSDFKFQPHNEAEFLQGILNAAKEAFEEYFFGIKNKTLKTFIYGACKLIADLYINNVLTSTEFEFYVDKIIEIVRKKPTALNIHCYHNIVIVPSSEMKKRKDKKLLHKSLNSQKEFECLVDIIQPNLSDLGSTHLDDEIRIETNFRDEACGPSTDVETIEEIQENSIKEFKNLPTRDFKFYEPKSAQNAAFKININKTKDFKLLIDNLTPNENLIDFKPANLKSSLITNYVIILVLKIGSDRRFARAIAEICGKINEKNNNFSAEIAMMTKNIFLSKLKDDESFLGFLEFLTMLNIHCDCKNCSELFKFVIFKIFEANWCKSSEQFNILQEFLCLNTQKIQKFPYYVNFDIIYQMKFFNHGDSTVSEKTIAEFNESCGILRSNQFEANPSLKVAMNFLMTDQSNEFEKVFANPQDLRILTPTISAIYFISNAISPTYNLEENLIQNFYASLLEFIVENSPNDVNVKIFMDTILSTLKRDFFRQHIKINETEEISPELIKGTAAFISELYRHNLMHFNDYKMFLKFMVDRFMTDTNEITEACNVSIFTNGYAKHTGEHKKDSHIARFIQTSIVTNTAAKKSGYHQGLKDEASGSDGVEKKKRQIIKRNTKKSSTATIPKRPQSSAPVNHEETFPAFKLAVESLLFDGSQFNLTNIPEDNLQEYLNYIIEQVWTKSKIFLVYIAKICTEFDETFGKKLFIECNKKLENIEAETFQQSIGMIQKLANFMIALYNYGVINGEIMGIFFNNFEVFQGFSEDIFNDAMDVLKERDPEIYFRLIDRRYDLSLQNNSIDDDDLNVHPSFINLITTIENDEELFTTNVRIDDAENCASYFFYTATQNAANAEKFANFLANPPITMNIDLLTFEVLTLTLRMFDRLSVAPLDALRKPAAAAFLAELFNVGLIGFRIMEDIVKVLGHVDVLTSDLQNFQVFRIIIKRINQKVIDSHDYGMRKFFESKVVKSLNIDELEIEKKNERFNHFNSFYQIEDFSATEEKNLISTFLDQIEKNDKDEMLLAIKNCCSILGFIKALKIAVNAVVVYSLDTDKYLDNLIAMLIDFKSQSSDQKMFRTAFKYAIDNYYETCFESSEKAGAELKMNFYIGELSVELINYSILRPNDIITHWMTILKKSKQKQDLYKLMKKANEKIFKVNEGESSSKLNYLRDELIKSVKADSNLKHLIDMTDILQKFGVNLIQIKKELSLSDLQNLEVEDQKPKSSKKPRKRNKKRKKNKNATQENLNQDEESDSSEKLLSEESQPKVQEQLRESPKSEIKNRSNEKSIQDSGKLEQDSNTTKSVNLSSQIEIDTEVPTLESESDDEISSFDVDGFKLLIAELEFCSKNQIAEKIKMIKIEGKSCLKIMTRTYLEEMSSMDEKSIEGVVKIIDNIFYGFKNILGREIIKMLNEKLKDGFWNFNELQKLTKETSKNQTKFKIPQHVENTTKTENHQESAVTSNQNKKKKNFLKKSKIQIQSEKSPDEKPEKQNSKEILNRFKLEARKTQNLLNFSIELFNLGWISFKNFQKLLEYFIAEENFEMVSKILKATSTRISQSSKVFTIKTEISPKKFDHQYLNFVELLENIQKSAKNNSKKIKIMKENLEICDLENFVINFLKIQNFEFLVDEILKEFISHAILNDSKEFAKAVENLNVQNQKHLIKILIKKFKNLVENENSKLFEILGILDLFASLLVVEVAQIYHFDKIFEIMMNENSKFLRVFFETFGAQFEKFFPENFGQYFEEIETKFKLSNSKNLSEILKFRAVNFVNQENSEIFLKIENIFSKLTSENHNEISFKIQKLIHHDFTEFVKILWKFVLQNPQNSQNYLKLCESFKNSKNFRSKLEEFLIYRRRAFLRIANDNFPVNARTKLENVVKFIENLHKAEILSENHLKLWIEPHVMIRIKFKNI